MVRILLNDSDVVVGIMDTGDEHNISGSNVNDSRNRAWLVLRTDEGNGDRVGVKEEPDVEIGQNAKNSENEPINHGRDEESADEIIIRDESYGEVKEEPIQEEVLMRRFMAREIDSDDGSNANRSTAYTNRAKSLLKLQSRKSQ